MPPLKTIAFCTTNDWASSLAILRVLGPAQIAGLHVLKGNQGVAIFPENIKQAQAVVIQRDFPRFGEAFEEILAHVRAESKPLIYDLDDLLLELPEYHPDRITHYYSEALLPILRAIISANIVTASASLLCEYLKSYNPNVRLLPNYLNDQIWKLQAPRPPEAERHPIVIGYMGGDSHVADIQYVAPALRNIARRYADQIELHFLGVAPADELAELPNVKWSPVKTFDYAKFAVEFVQEEYDIVIAPLRNNLFNRCKSSIKYFEYTAIGAPGVYSRIEPYASIVQHGENGYLASSLDEWEDYLSQLIVKPMLRYEMALKAQASLRENWLLSEHAGRWVEAYQQSPAFNEPIGGTVTVPTQTFIDLISQTQAGQHELEAQLQLKAREAEQLRETLADKEEYIVALSNQLASYQNSLPGLILRAFRRARSYFGKQS